MEGVLFVILGIVVLGAFGFLVYLGYLAEKQRREALAALARRWGWRFDPRTDWDHDDVYDHFEIFCSGHSRAAFNTLTGAITVCGRQCPVKMGDFTYKVTRSTGKGTRTSTYHFSYMILHLAFGRIPDLLIRREGLLDKLADAFGFDDIDFESAEFSRRFRVKSPSKRFAYDVINPRMMEFLMAGEGPVIDIEYGRCCISDGQERWEPEEFESALAWIRQFFDLWPEHVVDALGE
jgi:hypothetical protein